MTSAAKGPPPGEEDGPIELSSLAASIISTVGQSSPEKQAEILGATKRAPNPAVAAAIKDLTAEFAVEPARIASIYAVHFVEDMEIGDHWAAEHDMRGAVLHLREAARKFREWQGKPLPARGNVA